MHLPEVTRRHVGADTEEHQAEDQIAHTSGGHPQQPDEEHEEERGKPDVVLETDDGHGGAPGDQDRKQWPGIEDQPVADLGRRDGEQLLVLREVGREEDAQQDLGELDGLEGQAAVVHPETGAADGGEEERSDEEDAGQEQQQIAIALQIS